MLKKNPVYRPDVVASIRLLNTNRHITESMWWIFLPKMKIEIVVSGAQVDSIGNAIVKAAKIDNEKNFVSPIEKAVHIRAGELDAESV